MSAWVRLGSSSSKLPSQTRSALSRLNASTAALRSICCPCAACWLTRQCTIHSGGWLAQAACAFCICCCCTPRCCRTTICRHPLACCAATCTPTPSGERLGWACAAAMVQHPTATAPAVLHQLHSKMREVEQSVTIVFVSCRDGLEEVLHAIVCDPPYGVSCRCLRPPPCRVCCRSVTCLEWCMQLAALLRFTTTCASPQRTD